MKDVAKLLKVLKPYIPFMILSLIASAVTVGMQLYSPILSGRAIDCIIGKGNVLTARLTTIMTRFILVVIISIIFQWIMNMINNAVVYRVVRDLRTRIYEHINKLPVSYVDSHEYGDIVSRTLNDVDRLSDGMLLGFSQLFTGVITILGTIFFMFRTSAIVALVVIILTPLSLLVAGFITKKTYNMFKLQSEQRSDMTSLVNEMVGNEKTVQSLLYEERAAETFDKVNNELSDAEFRATFFSSLTNPSTRLINNIVYAGVAIVGAIIVISGSITVGQLTCLLGYATQFAKPFNEISGVMTELSAAIASVSRVFELLEEEPESDDTELDELIEIDGDIVLSDISFSYDKTKKLIDHLSLSVKPGQKIAIVGPTGSGKSTLINLLMRFYDVDKGDIRIDNQDIYEVTRKSLRHEFGMVLQETWLKSGTIRDNIAYGYPEATDEEVEKAARLTHADRFITKLADGYDTVLAEDGGNLSAGQKQLLCITRVMLHIPPMLILDEATSSIDTRTEQRVQRSFDKMMRGRTSFVVAHRLSTIREADIILVMNDGAVIEQGSHAELIARRGFYYNLYNSQFANNV
ncbi:ATP-binding cassette, subfamily B [Lachnospiraceae bacterium NE2001]|nr:ATP-binding cassette, subfamily B [Lachnospiraceae bacterium NE2001]